MFNWKDNEIYGKKGTQILGVQGDPEVGVPESIVETKLHEVLPAFEPQGPQEVPELHDETKPLEVTEDQINPMPQDSHEVLPTDQPKKTTLKFVNIW